MNLRAEFKDKLINKTYSILRARFANSNVAAYIIIGVKLYLLRQASKKFILNYITK